MTLKQEKGSFKPWGLGALNDDETPIYRTWQCQTLKSEAKRALQSTISEGGWGENEGVRKTITDLGDQDKIQ
jgi:hypothetical protein